MSSKTENLLDEFAHRMMTALDKGVDFASQEIPILLNEVLYWGFAKSLFFFILFLILFVTCVRVILKKRQEEKENRAKAEIILENSEKRLFHLLDCGSYYFVNDGSVVERREKGDGGPYYMPYVALSIAAALSAIAITFRLDWLKIVLAPRLYLLEYASNLL